MNGDESSSGRYSDWSGLLFVESQSKPSKLSGAC